MQRTLLICPVQISARHPKRPSTPRPLPDPHTFGHRDGHALGTEIPTTNHGTIRNWVEARGGCPASVKSTRTKGDPGVLRIDFHSVIGEHTLECVPWDEWFRGFEENNLAFLYEDEKDSRFNKLIGRDKSR